MSLAIPYGLYRHAGGLDMYRFCMLYVYICILYVCTGRPLILYNRSYTYIHTYIQYIYIYIYIYICIYNIICMHIQSSSCMHMVAIVLHHDPESLHCMFAN